MSIQYSSPLPYLGMLASARPVCPTWSQFDKHSRRWKSPRSSNALGFPAAFRDIILLKRVIAIITLTNKKKIFHSLFLACASFASASLSVPWNQAACNANAHSKPSGMFYLRFISSYFFLQSEEIISHCTFIGGVHSHPFCLCMRAHAHTHTRTQRTPAAPRGCRLVQRRLLQSPITCRSRGYFLLARPRCFLAPGR